MKREFVVTFYDYLFDLTKFVFKEINSSKVVCKGDYFIKNVVFNEQLVSFVQLNSGDHQRITGSFQFDQNIDRIVE